MKQELERRSTLENRNWSDRSSRSTTTTPLGVADLTRGGVTKKFEFLRDKNINFLEVLR